MTKAEPVIVYPTFGASLPGVTTRPTSIDPATAIRLVASRAFSYDVPKDEVEITPFDEAERPALDVWVSPVAHGDHYKSKA